MVKLELMILQPVFTGTDQPLKKFAIYWFGSCEPIIFFAQKQKNFCPKFTKKSLTKSLTKLA